ncbi:sensor histidine kinase [Ethanoligenens harbinense]|uniref:histidine kinase n=1 Tax=Ethanoligenens harbinense (strain DSM 18485 / JCM 12961 / CGMCC 1.5033 / YUAN-3) TaxID=663278 RepID=E6UA33_ETHHY|nr:HAMP domain-containing sensor histidine kinase [Ethanoligenens harbinense]ADU27394.1 integral membrane sensor signal transduction histidine kinase [Ethanoligenens harbinense YUAN-3]AVQ96453.1 sensor histidine kinase [Ethanoligenens harbinense YUAN-3]AYF39112.1 sensor histidine kinase [Ethanoligenens harbinense]AYF41938.1 sensor histidine kinase [Ethanoligenens harbinense]QCN92694.1 sensor histidine kinase [Ethanoligenens harbinense]
MNLWRSKGFRRTFLLFLSLFAVLTMTALMVLWQNGQAMTAALVRQDIALAGGMARGQPTKSLSILTGETTSADLDAGQNLLAPYSYNQELPLAASRTYQQIFDRQILTFAACAVALFLAALAVFGGYAVRMNRKFRGLSQKIASGEFSDAESNREDGDYAALEEAVSALARRADFHVQALQKDKNFLKNLLSDISHQIKTPLAGLRMYCDILLSKPDLSTEQRVDFLQRSKRQIERTDWLVQGLLKMARVEAGAIRMNLRDAYLVDTVEETVEPFTEWAQRQQIRLDAQVSPDLHFRHDTEWVAEALANLIKNALEHTPAGGTVMIRAEETPLTVSVHVKDNGEGITPEEIPHIFERFYRKGGAHTQNAGIGLSLAKELIEKNGGEIFADSTPGQGSAFIVTFLKQLPPSQS